MVPRSGYFFASAENVEESLDNSPPGAVLFRHFLPVRLGFGLVQGSLGGVLFCVRREARFRLTTLPQARYYLDTSSPPARALDLFNAPRSGYFFAVEYARHRLCGWSEPVSPGEKGLASGRWRVFPLLLAQLRRREVGEGAGGANARTQACRDSLLHWRSQAFREPSLACFLGEQDKVL